MFPMLPFANCIRDNRFTFEGRHEVTANMAGTRLNFHGSGWQSPWRVASVVRL
jgi:galactose mutarotase-like enzyme